MAGYLIRKFDSSKPPLEFHIGSKNLPERLLVANFGRRVMNIQADGDELDAILWGLANYKKEAN